MQFLQREDETHWSFSPYLQEHFNNQPYSQGVLNRLNINEDMIFPDFREEYDKMRRQVLLVIENNPDLQPEIEAYLAPTTEKNSDIFRRGNARKYDALATYFKEK